MDPSNCAIGYQVGTIGSVVLGSNATATESSEVALNDWHLYSDGTIQFKNGPRLSFKMLAQAIDDIYNPDGAVFTIVKRLIEDRLRLALQPRAATATSQGDTVCSSCLCLNSQA